MIATEISAASRPYSIAVAPKSSWQSDLPKLRNFFTSVTPYTLHYRWLFHVADNIDDRSIVKPVVFRFVPNTFIVH